jgi:hypothetical protein
VSYTTWRHNWQAWLTGSDFVPDHRLHYLTDISVEWLELDQCMFTANLLVSSDDYAWLKPTGDQFIFFQRRNHAQMFCIESKNRTWAINPETGLVERALKLAGRGGAGYFLSLFEIQANPLGTDIGQTHSGYRDDVIKAFIRYNMELGTAYSDPNGIQRGLAGLTVVADASEHPDSTEISRRGNLWKVVKTFCEDWDVDLTFTPAWNGPDAAITFTVDTHYQGRGTDKTSDSEDPVILAETYRNMVEGESFDDRLNMWDRCYTPNTRDIVYANGTAGLSGYLRREGRIG